MPKRRKRSDRKSLRWGQGCEALEARWLLDGGGFAGNACPPDLNLDDVADQTATVGQLFELDLMAAGATIEDLDGDGLATGDTLTFMLDPDVPSDTPLGAEISADGVLRWTPMPDQEGAHTIVVLLVDQGTPALADAEVFQITVEAAPNTAPVVDLNGAADGVNFDGTYTENDPATSVVASDATVVDTTSAELTGGTITLTNPLDGTAESLSVDTTGTTITADYDDATGVLTLSGTASVDDYQTVLRTLSYENTSDNPDTTAREIQVTVTDGTDSSAVATSTLQVVAINDAPDMATIDDVATTVGNEIEVTITASDAESDTLTFFLDPETAPAGATLEQIDNVTAVVRWTPEAQDGTGPHEFRVLVSDDGTPARVDSEQFFVSVNMSAASVDLNGPADGQDFEATFTENGGAVLIVDSELSIEDDGESLSSATVTITNLADGASESLSVDVGSTGLLADYDDVTGVLTISGSGSLADYEAVLQTLSYNNASNDPSTDPRAITVVLNDGNSDGPAATSTVEIIAVNDAPNLVLPAPYDDGETPVEVMTGTTISFTAIATDLDHDNDDLTFALDLDQSGIPDGATMPTIDSATGGFSWTPDMAGCFEITVIVTDADGAADQESFLVLVEESAASIQAPATDVAEGNSEPSSDTEPPDSIPRPTTVSEVADEATPTDQPPEMSDEMAAATFFAGLGKTPELPVANSMRMINAFGHEGLSSAAVDQVMAEAYEVHDHELSDPYMRTRQLPVL